MPLIVEPATFYRRHLPHWQPDRGIFFITYRLQMPLPEDVRLCYARWKQDLYSRQVWRGRERTPQEDALAFKTAFQMIDRYLDTCRTGPRWLHLPEVAKVVTDSLMYMHQRQYKLHGFTIMPNHAHDILEPLPGGDGAPVSLARILQGHKGATSRRANLLIGREGTFWEDESFDHVIRSWEEYYDLLDYTMKNPVKAGLVKRPGDWPYTWLNPEEKEMLGLDQP